jgi:hypothetical protein
LSRPHGQPFEACAAKGRPVGEAAAPQERLQSPGARFPLPLRFFSAVFPFPALRRRFMALFALR